MNRNVEESKKVPWEPVGLVDFWAKAPQTPGVKPVWLAALTLNRNKSNAGGLARGFTLE
jgi:hypothetical protein